jgi:hypothetical protein
MAVVPKVEASGKVTVIVALVPLEASTEMTDMLLPVRSTSPDPTPIVVFAEREVTCVAPVVIAVPPMYNSPASATFSLKPVGTFTSTPDCALIELTLIVLAI